jgi:hypothetical protein
VKTLPLYVGIVLVVAAIAGALATALHTPASDPEPAALAPPPPVEGREEEEEGPSTEEVAKQDEDDSRRILYEQVGQTPEDITEEWLEQLCQYVRSEEDLEQYWDETLEVGRRYAPVYEEANRNEAEVFSGLAQVYIFEAREFIHTQVPDADMLKNKVPKLLALAVYRAWVASLDDEMSTRRGAKKTVAQMLLSVGEPVESDEAIAAAHKEAIIPDETKSSFLIEALQALDLQVELAEEGGQDPRQFMEQRIRLHEVALVEGYAFIKKKSREARERYSQSALSSAGATLAIGRWQATLNSRLLSLGKIYIDAALAETTYRGRQQEYADLGFDALAMVFQRSKTGAAITVLREANKIQRYNLWQMGRAAWRQAQLAVKSGEIEEAKDQYFTAKQRYLQTLSRLERSKQPVVLEEYKRLQTEITTWTRATVEAAEG